MTEGVGLLVIVAAVLAVVRGAEVRLVLIVAALLLGLIAGQAEVIVQTFLATMAREQFVVPICCAMGFAHVLKATGCDAHLIQLLTKPMIRIRLFLIPGTVLIGFVVNIPIISQTSTALAVGSVLVPLLLAAGLSPLTVGSALLLGASIGGELLNPGAPELNTVATALSISPTVCVEHVLPLLIVHLIVATALFWWLRSRAERQAPPAPIPPTPAARQNEPFRVNYLKAAVPMVPLVLLFLTGPPLNLIPVENSWLLPAKPAATENFNSRLIGAAMLVGVAVAALSSPRAGKETAKAFFEGAGYAFTHIISLIVAANCFGDGVKLVGLAKQIGALVEGHPLILRPAAVFLPMAFAWICGSGMASTQSLYSFFVTPARTLEMDPIHVGALVSIGAAAGRTMSAVAAVSLMCGNLTNTRPLDLAKAVTVPLLGGLVAALLAAYILN